jgi:ABC-type transporter Mla maintaining outer membrane lipid asymmetry permease subunit MlaE
MYVCNLHNFYDLLLPRDLANTVTVQTCYSTSEAIALIGHFLRGDWFISELWFDWFIGKLQTRIWKEDTVSSYSQFEWLSFDVSGVITCLWKGIATLN